jgi:phosphomannomutase
MKRLIVFDLDGTLAKSKSPLDGEMSGLLHALLGIVKVAVISGGAWPQFESQVLSNLTRDERLTELSLLPTCGTKFFAYDAAWKELYSEDLSADDRSKIIATLRKSEPAHHVGPHPSKPDHPDLHLVHLRPRIRATPRPSASA